MIKSKIIMNLNQVTVPSINIDQSIKFYQKLGLQLIVHTGPHYARFLCPQGQSTFSIHKVDALPIGDGIMVYFECNELDQKVDELLSEGIVFDQLPKNQRWLWREARLRDPDGHQIILFYAGENRINPPWKILPAG